MTRVSRPYICETHSDFPPILTTCSTALELVEYSVFRASIIAIRNFSLRLYYHPKRIKLVVSLPKMMRELGSVGFTTEVIINLHRNLVVSVTPLGYSKLACIARDKRKRSCI